MYVLRQMVEAVKPGGRVLINDIRHLRQYAGVFREHGCPETQLKGSWFIAALLAVITMGSLRPGILLARKAP